MEIVGGKLSDPSYVTDFSMLMRGYIEGELSQKFNIRLVSGDSKKKTHSLHGVYQVTNSEVNIKLALRNIKSGSAKVKVASTFPRDVIPDGVRVLP
jgi:hypothetical protein